MKKKEIAFPLGVIIAVIGASIVIAWPRVGLLIAIAGFITMAFSSRVRQKIIKLTKR
ncbi:MAG: hypothetical protein ABIB71_00040 [Candidatus Woesearchaeota archaeon]